uniref:protein-disulfide reductase DsbD family protein n=1 Tax=Parasutterella excrementihominis TaxID=487175 RepID=UPI003AEFF472
LNLAGAFEFSGVRISSSGQASSNSLAGSFATGILAVVVASPCTAPFMGAALGFALSATALESFVVFICLGLGMSLPWLLLALFPCLTAWLPHPGRWMGIFRTVMAIPMALTALWLFWVLWQQVSLSALGAYLCAAALLTLALILYGRLQFGKAASKGVMELAFALCAGAYAVAASPLLDRAPAEVHTADAWSPAAVQAALDEGRPVFVDFTASWCVTCQANKLAVLDRDNVQKAFKEHNVKFFIADWTNRNAEISKTLESFGRTGVPLYLLYAPDGTAKILPELLTQDIVIEALNTLPKGSPK